MDNKDIMSGIQEEVRNSIDSIILFGIVMTTLTTIPIVLSDISPVFIYFHIAIIIYLVLVYLFRKKISLKIKILIVISLLMSISIILFIDGGFETAFITFMAINLFIAAIFLNKELSISVIIISLLVYAGFWVWTSQKSIDNIHNIGFAEWSMKYLTLILYIAVLYASVYLIKKFLQDSISKIEKNRDEIFKIAYYDKLTNLPNQYLFQKELSKKLHNNEKGHLIYVSLKNLNIINSVHGEEIGDRTLIDIGDTFKNTIKESGLVGRVSGNEFAMFISEDIDYETYLEESKHKFHNRYHLINTPIKIKLDIGVIHCHDSKVTAVSYMHDVNIALTYAKENNAKKTIIYNKSLEEGIRFEEKLKERLESAVMLKNIGIHYQTQVNGITKKVIGVEALARWKSTEFGNVSPSIFIPIIEKLNLAGVFGEYIIDKAFSEYKMLCNKYNEDICISINISPSHLLSDDFIFFIKGKIDEYNIPADRVVLDITEDIFIDGVKETNSVFIKLRELGMKIAIDNFGSRYSSLNYLSSIKVDGLKIDRLFISQIDNNEKVSIILEFLVKISKEYNINLVAKGVETKKQFDKLTNMGFVNIQGFYFSRPEEI